MSLHLFPVIEQRKGKDEEQTGQEHEQAQRMHVRINLSGIKLPRQKTRTTE